MILGQEKAGIRTDPRFIKRFVYKKEDGGLAYDNEGDGIYIEGKDKLISKILVSKEHAYIFVDW